MQLNNTINKIISNGLPKRGNSQGNQLFMQQLKQQTGQNLSNKYQGSHTLEGFGECVFGDEVMRERLPLEVYLRVVACRDCWEPIDLESAEIIAEVLRVWAMELGATHWCHWFQPMINGRFSEKHEAFLDYSRGKFISTFHGSELILQEPDGSSFPSGGLRHTHIARGYTVWDPLSPIFVKEVGETKIMAIPSLFISWTGEALDRKTPLLRSMVALTKSTRKLWSVVGLPAPKYVRANSGCEQEFYLVEKDAFDDRIDLRITGRTVQGAPPFKNQELCDHYLGPLPTRAINCIEEMEKESWKLGIPIKTRHQEVAPNQFEMAPIFESCSTATDHNLILMELMKNVASKHGLMAIFHEKPFSGYNGSGKHNNWSVGTDLIPTIFNPTEDMDNNLAFKLGLTAVIRGVDLHQDVIRLSISSAGNDHRLGSNEAPPSIISIYLGESVSNFVEKLISGKEVEKNSTKLDLGIPYLCKFDRHYTDRNRTSPFAFTGNKFEVRCVGGSHNPAISNTVLNTMLADSFDYLSEEITKLTNSGTNLNDAISKVIGETLSKHKRIIFDGNGYSQEWVQEAEERGLLNLNNTPHTVKYCFNDKNFKLFGSQEVMNHNEFESFLNVEAENYYINIETEAKALLALANRYIIPACLDYLQKFNFLTKSPKNEEVDKILERFAEIQHYINESFGETFVLEGLLQELDGKVHNLTALEKSEFCGEKILPAMQSLRKDLDSLELLIPAKEWPIPSITKLIYTILN